MPLASRAFVKGETVFTLRVAELVTDAVIPRPHFEFPLQLAAETRSSETKNYVVIGADPLPVPQASDGNLAWAGNLYIGDASIGSAQEFDARVTARLIARADIPAGAQLALHNPAAESSTKRRKVLAGKEYRFGVAQLSAASLEDLAKKVHEAIKSGDALKFLAYQETLIAKHFEINALIIQHAERLQRLNQTARVAEEIGSVQSNALMLVKKPFAKHNYANKEVVGAFANTFWRAIYLIAAVEFKVVLTAPLASPLGATKPHWTVFAQRLVDSYVKTVGAGRVAPAAAPAPEPEPEPEPQGIFTFLDSSQGSQDAFGDDDLDETLARFVPVVLTDDEYERVALFLENNPARGDLIIAEVPSLRRYPEHTFNWAAVGEQAARVLHAARERRLILKHFGTMTTAEFAKSAPIIEMLGKATAEEKNMHNVAIYRDWIDFCRTNFPVFRAKMRDAVEQFKTPF